MRKFIPLIVAMGLLPGLAVEPTVAHSAGIATSMFSEAALSPESAFNPELGHKPTEILNRETAVIASESAFSAPSVFQKILSTLDAAALHRRIYNVFRSGYSWRSLSHHQPLQISGVTFLAMVEGRWSVFVGKSRKAQRLFSFPTGKVKSPEPDFLSVDEWRALERAGIVLRGEYDHWNILGGLREGREELDRLVQVGYVAGRLNTIHPGDAHFDVHSIIFVEPKKDPDIHLNYEYEGHFWIPLDFILSCSPNYVYSEVRGYIRQQSPYGEFMPGYEKMFPNLQHILLTALYDLIPGMAHRPGVEGKIHPYRIRSAS